MASGFVSTISPNPGFKQQLTSWVGGLDDCTYLLPGGVQMEAVVRRLALISAQKGQQVLVGWTSAW